MRISGFLLRSWCSPLFSAVVMQVESEDAVRGLGPPQYLRVTQSTHGIVVAGAPMLLHAPARKFVIFRLALIGFCAVDELDDVVGLVLDHRLQLLHFRAIAHMFGDVGAPLVWRSAHPLHALEAAGAGAGSARINDLLSARLDFGGRAGGDSARAPGVGPTQRCVL